MLIRMSGTFILYSRKEEGIPYVPIQLKSAEEKYCAIIFRIICGLRSNKITVFFWFGSG